MSFSKVVMVGRIGKDPEVRYSQNGTAFGGYSLALEHKVGEEKMTDWINVKGIGKTAEFMEKWLHKGDMILVEGTLQTDNFTDKKGNQRQTTFVLASSHHFVGSKKTDNTDSQDTITDEDGFMNVSADEEDLPFM